ncbi:hypothetical protein A3K29_05715 [Candidatus Collierbacteria bacterium RIFOXYB2_FULL_46_14]|uniref:Uncharacterized protein n=1 Tax=Candidatus Collierbacteria bacterium GW2011_GWA2_46_26 TaxID=1618381 RepID=A0A0G1PIF0_9BACT|nr:MAG: hypothetical protein UX47_C0009G0016 [Candidatus Collierbacteria bacterium GW2011_GWA2_46_26]OGD73586.1 MAG: hypothetical protein A3K29_05715 [Candidatus Collierbacteria bacterium RIFOXYB2_FULL_46_14]OGD76628.1 MAG: hypothetical protein A3K43_05715 [Candidatus Collierbacteria bacterium RIFOXYA2_FULL_46_20]OGD77964.1 MAG: hypothetical protein A3K39_05715 [Candidatus Collierbacteria bacterium RIFOXYC2_FULL_43_15]OGD79988.1 MAG: hypothetical protein A2320_00145 [Pseudomonadales bacterium G
MNRKTLIVSVVVILTMILSGVLYLSQKGAQRTELNVRGGDVFFGKANTRMDEFNDGLGFDLTVVDGRNTCSEKGVWEDVDLIQAGTLNCLNEVKALVAAGKIPNQQVFSEMVISTSPYVLAIKSNPDQDDLTPLMEAGYVYTEVHDGRTTYFIDPDKMTALVMADVENKKFTDLGINIDNIVNIGFPKSTVGVPSADLLLAYYFKGGQDMIGSEALMKFTDPSGKEVTTLSPEYAKVLIALYERSGKVLDSSLDFCHNWLNQRTDSVHISIFSESCYTSWAIKYADKAELMKEKGNVLVYMKKTATSTFTLFAVSKKGQDYLDAIANNVEFFQTVSETTGMRGSGLVSIAPIQFADFIPSNEPWSLIAFPFEQLTSATRYVLDNYAK